jgi:hypothetical protein
MPQATSKGGAVMTAPKLVAISFDGDSLQSAVDAFASQLQTNTEYWSGATSEYGVGPITTTTFHSTDTPAAVLQDSDVQGWITNEIQNDTTFPKPDANTMYMLFYPAGTNVMYGGEETCDQFEGYHEAFLSTLSSSGNIAYGVVPRCSPPDPNVTYADQMTAEGSHEIIEAATDPTPSDGAAYLTVDSSSHAWELLAGGEIGDLCAAFPDSFYKPTGFTTLVQRVWSNAAAAASHDPCEPDGTTPYFNSAPVLPDTITIDLDGNHLETAGVKLAQGASATIELDLYSDGPTSGPWTLSAIDITSMFFGGSKALSFSFDTTTGQNGDVVHLTITSLQAVDGGAPFWIQSDLGGAGCYVTNSSTGTVDPCTVWLGAVSTN